MSDFTVTGFPPNGRFYGQAHFEAGPSWADIGFLCVLRQAGREELDMMTRRSRRLAGPEFRMKVNLAPIGPATRFCRLQGAQLPI
jgi:hypothetical protein